MKFEAYGVDFKSASFPEPEDFDGRKIIVEGIGRCLYQEGFYPTLTFIHVVRKRGYEICWFKMCDELLRENWKIKSILSVLREYQSFTADSFDLSSIELFLESDYEAQRKMLFDFFFNSREEAVKTMREILGIWN